MVVLSFVLPPPPQVTHDRQRGLVVFLRVYAGTLHAKEPLQNSTRDVKERPLQLLEVRADELAPVERVGSGHTVAAVGLKGTYTGDTLVAYKVGRCLSQPVKGGGVGASFCFVRFLPFFLPSFLPSVDVH